MVDEIRNKWCDDLEDLIQCPICMERPRNSIYQCQQGHHICEFCKPQLERCPTCMQHWSESRNRLAEHLCLKLDEIKLSLIDPENEINKLLIPDTVSVASQTDEIAVAERPAPRPPGEGHGDKAYPCRIGACTTQRFYEPLLKHLILDHPQEFSEIPSQGHVFEHTWTFDFSEQFTFDRAFLIADMGTFFLKLASDIFGTFTGFVLMIHNGFVAKHYEYQLEIRCCADHTCPIYTNEVCSCRTPPGVLREKCLRIAQEEMIKLIKHKKKLSCTVLIGKKRGIQDADQKEKCAQKNSHRRNPQQNGQNKLGAGPSNYRPNFNRVSRPQTAPNDQPRRLTRARSRQRLASACSMGSLDLDFLGDFQ